MRKVVFLSAILFALNLYSPLQARGAVQVEVLEKEILATIQVANLYQCTLKITFEEVLGLNDNSLSITAVQVNPLDPGLINRLQSASLMSVPGQFPILITVSPSATSTLTFTGAYEVELSTSNLAFTSNTPFRLFKAPAAGSFEDISNFVGMGSYRVRGTSGDFSDFLIVADVRNLNDVIEDKFAKLQQTIANNSSKIAPPMLQNLQAKFKAAYDSYRSGQKLNAVSELQAMINDIKADAGDTIPNTYRANDPATHNIAGELRRRAATLIFSLNL